MSKINTVHEIDVSTASFPYSLLLASRVSRYKIYGSKALTVNIVINASGTPLKGMVVYLDYTAVLTNTVAISRFGDYYLSIFGTRIPYSLQARKLKIMCEYLNGVWGVFILQSADVLPYIKLEAIDPAILDPVSLAVDPGTGLFKIAALGVTYTELASDSVITAKILDDNVTLGKMAPITRGSIIVGNASGDPAELVAKTSAQYLMGDGTDIKSVAQTGDVTPTAGGVWAIGAGKVLSAMVLAGELVAAHLSAAAALLFTQMAALTVSKIPVLNASGFIEAGTVDAAKLSYINVTTPGTREANKAIVVGATGKIDALDIIAITYNGILLTPTPAQLNFITGLTSNAQAQIDAVGQKASFSVLSGTQTILAANLKASHIVDSSGGITDITLPSAGSFAADTVVEFMRSGVNGAAILHPVGDTLTNTSAADVASLALASSGDSMRLRSNGVSNWRVIGWIVN